MAEDSSLLSEREQIVIAGIVSGDTRKDALLKAGYSDTTAASHSVSILNRPRVQNALRLALEKAGVTIDKIAQVAADGLDANRPIVVDKSLCDYPDHGTRHRFLETVVKLSGLEPASDIDISAESYESRIMSIVAASQPIDIAAITETDDNCCTIIEAKSTVLAPQENNNDNDCGDPNDVGISYDI